MNLKLSKIKVIAFVIFLAFIVLNIVYRPRLLENKSFSRAAFDRNGKLLKLTLNNEDRYRLFVPFSKIPSNLKESVLFYEDRYFYYHPGFNPFSFIRAFYSLFGSRRYGASTITMQVARINSNINTKTISGKLFQILKAIQLEVFYSKDEIFEAYFNLVPYGHNIEGVGAASLIYFNMEVNNLSNSEALALTVIPQNPIKRVPTNKNGFYEMEKVRKKLANSMSLEILPIKVNLNLPNRAMHTVQELLNASNNSNIKTTIDLNLQDTIEKQLKFYIMQKQVYGVSNGAVLLIDSENMEVLASIGSADFFNKGIQGQVNGVKALRSPGSALKPFIYALALDQGLIHSRTILKDIPKSFGVYNPENSDRQFMGTLPADLALVYSRNVPAVDLLKKLNTGSFYNLLIKSGLNLKSEDYYGLALALGGYEISMEKIVELYASLLNRGVLKPLKKEIKNNEDSYEVKILSPEASYITLKMLEKNEPINSYSKYVKLKNQDVVIPWKTGTSFGYKDALAVGTVGPYVLAVWIGNFDGTGNNAFKGREMAGPLFFSIANNIAKTTNKVKKYKYNTIGLNVREIDVCSETGDIKTTLCSKSEKALFIPTVSPIKSSNIYRKIPINIKTGKRACYSNPPYTKDEVFEFWPSDLEKAREFAGIYLKKPPEFDENCDLNTKYISSKAPEIISPMSGVVYYKQLNRKMPLKASVDSSVKKIFWFSNQKFITESNSNETVFIDPDLGNINITILDDNGNSNSINITVKSI